MRRPDGLYKLDPPIPGFWFVNPGFSFYHTTEDAETIDYRVMKADVRFLANAITETAEEVNDWTFVDETEPDTNSAVDVRALLAGLHQRSAGIGERAYLESVVADLDEAIEADDISLLGDLDAFTFGVAWFVMFELGYAHRAGATAVSRRWLSRIESQRVVGASTVMVFARTELEKHERRAVEHLVGRSRAAVGAVGAHIAEPCDRAAGANRPAVPIAA